MNLTDPIFHDETKARAYLESIRWPDGPYCPHCGEFENVKRLKGKSHRPGLHQCNACRGHFSVTVGTLYERSKVPLHKWLLATRLLSSSKKGFSAHQLHRTLGVTYKTAWFMAHRIREAMRDTDDKSPLGGEGQSVEADETFTGGKAKNRAYKEPPKKEPVVALVERGGKVRSFHVRHVSSVTLKPILFENIDRASRLQTDQATYYKEHGKEFDGHGTVNHSIDEYVRGNDHTNSVEGYFSIFKRGIMGTYHHVSEKHLKRYLGEFDFRYNERIRLGVDDTERTDKALKGITGKRLTYRRTGEGAGA